MRYNSGGPPGDGGGGRRAPPGEGFRAPPGDGGRAPPGDGGGRPSTAPAPVSMESEDPISFTQLDEEWMGSSLVDLILGTQDSVNFGGFVQSQGASNCIMIDEDASNCEDASDSDLEEFFVRCEGDTDIDEPYPIDDEFVAVAAAQSKADLRKKTRGKQAKARAEIGRVVKKRAADHEGRQQDKGMDFSDQDSVDCKELSDSSDDDEVVCGDSLSFTMRKSRARKLEKRLIMMNQG